YGIKDSDVSRVIRLKNGDFVRDVRDTPYGVWQGVDGRGKEGIATPRDQWVNGDEVVTIPRRMDPDIQGTSLVKDVPALWADIAARPDNSVPVEEFYQAMEARVDAMQGGPELIKKIDAVIAEAEQLYQK